MYYLFLLKRCAEDVLMYPLILLGRCIALIKPLKESYDIFFFFPFYSIGGAEKVHAHIVQAVKAKKAIIYFTRRSQNNLFLDSFKQSGAKVFDISKFTDNKWLYPVNILFRGIISGYINRQKKGSIIFNGQCNFGYKIAPWIGRKNHQVELIHSFNSFSWIRIPFLSFYEKSIMISHQTISDHVAQYKKLSIPGKLGTKIIYLQNGIELPTQKLTSKTLKNNLTVLYVGRGSVEKRVHLIAAMAKQIVEKKIAAEVQFLGNVQEAIPETLHSYCRFLGPQSNPAVIQDIYRQADVLILTSVFEGFPMVVMEAMAQGLAIISTAVGDLPYHIQDGKNGYLIHAESEDGIVEEGVSLLQKIISERDRLREISAANKDYAYQHFGIDAFNKAYLRLFEFLGNE